MTLVAHYPLDEESGSTANDMTGNGYDGSVTGATMGATGILGTTCYEFDGTNDKVNFGNHPAFTDLSDFSINVWVRLGALNKIQSIVSKGPSAGNRNYELLHADHNSQITFFLRLDNNLSLGFSESEVTTDTWFMLTGTLGGGIGKLYLNGVERDSGAQSGSTGDSGYNLEVSNNHNGRELSAGSRVGELRFYDHALTPQEVAYLYSASKRGKFVSNKRTL